MTVFGLSSHCEGSVLRKYMSVGKVSLGVISSLYIGRNQTTKLNCCAVVVCLMRNKVKERRGLFGRIKSS